jgi:cytochrome c oxidase assembly factor CtaG
VTWHTGRTGLRMASSGEAGNESGILARFLDRARPWTAVVAVVLSLTAVLPPVATYGRQYVFVQALQFAVFAILTPVLLVLGIPRRATAPRRVDGEHSYPKPPPARVAARRLVPFMALVITWRLPGVLNALARYPALSAAELVTLLAAGLGLWLAIMGLSPRDALPRPLRAAMAAAAAWTIWIIAYITGMSSFTLSPGSPAAAKLIAAAADRQFAAAVLWLIPAVCFVPVVYYLVITWLSERGEQESEQRDLSAGTASVIAARRPPRGWRQRDSR